MEFSCRRAERSQPAALAQTDRRIQSLTKAAENMECKPAETSQSMRPIR